MFQRVQRVAPGSLALDSMTEVPAQAADHLIVLDAIRNGQRVVYHPAMRPVVTYECVAR